MPKLFVDEPTATAEVQQGTLMIHNAPPALVVIIDEVLGDGDFMGTSLEDGTRTQWASDQFTPFKGRLALEQ